MALAVKRRNVAFAAVVLAGAGVATVVFTGGGAPQVDPRVLPLTASARVTTTFTNCSPISEVGYIKNRPCDTYFLLATTRMESANALLAAERQRLIKAGWRHVAKASTWGYGSDTDGWIAPQRKACGVVLTALEGSHVEAQLEAQFVEPRALVAFRRAAAAEAHSPTLYVLLQPGENDGRPRC